MKRYFIISLLTLASTVAPLTAVFAQSSFIYEKGKSFKDVNASPMPQTIRLDRTAEPVIYENAVPENATTICYRIQLPSYVRGTFFSRDSRSGDYEWPNNTNRLLPWMFNHLTDLTRGDYPGIPSNARPSTLGDALLLQLTDGSYLFTKAVAGDNSLSWFQVNTDGPLNLYVSTLGTDRLEHKVPVALVQSAGNIYQVFRQAYETLISDRNVSALQKRTEKNYFEALNYLGWCTWEHYHFDIDETKILNDLDAIETSGVPVRYVLIDDGHLANKNRQLTSFTPDPQRFPNGWAPIMAHKNKDKIRWIGLWYALSGYWMGISPDNDFPTHVKNSLYSFNGSLLPGKSTPNIDTFYQYYVHSLKTHGFDFLKVDNQAFTLPLYMGSTEVVRQAKECNLALEKQTHAQQVGLMNCMAQNVLNTDHTLHSGVARVSIDYKKYNENMAKSHLFQSYTNTLLQGQTVWPDHDMFHSSDTICGSLMARSKAISGGPVYLSDSPKEFVKENIFPLIDKEGKIFRPEAPAIPTPESVLTNPLQDGKAYRVFAPTGDEAVSVICYNLNTSPKHRKVTAEIDPKDYLLRETLTGKPTPQQKRVILFDWNNQTATELTGKQTVELDGFTDRLFHLCPIHDGWAVIGIQEKYLSPAAVRILSSTPDKLVLNVFSPGTLKIWTENSGKQELRNIQVKETGKMTIRK